MVMESRIGDGPYPGVVLIAHAPGWDEYYREFSRRFAEHGFVVIAQHDEQMR